MPLDYNPAFIDSVHDYIHQGIVFHGSYDTGVIATAAEKELIFAVPADVYAHMNIEAYTNGEFSVDIYEGPTTSDDGTGITLFNKNRASSKSSTCVFSHTPTLSADGTLLEPIIVPGGVKTGGDIGELSADRWVLGPNTKYLIRLTNNAAGNARAVFHITFYEPSLL